jgi:hypothetical protein
VAVRNVAEDRPSLRTEMGIGRRAIAAGHAKDQDEN